MLDEGSVGHKRIASGEESAEGRFKPLTDRNQFILLMRTLFDMKGLKELLIIFLIFLSVVLLSIASEQKFSVDLEKYIISFNIINGEIKYLDNNNDFLQKNITVIDDNGVWYLNFKIIEDNKKTNDSTENRAMTLLCFLNQTYGEPFSGISCTCGEYGGVEQNAYNAWPSEQDFNEQIFGYHFYFMDSKHIIIWTIGANNEKANRICRTAYISINESRKGA